MIKKEQKWPGLVRVFRENQRVLDTLGKAVLSLFGSRRCLFCHAPLPAQGFTREILCSLCLPPSHSSESGALCCRICRRPLISEIDLCLDCRAVPWHFSSLWAPFSYRGQAAFLMMLYKFKCCYSLSWFWARQILPGISEKEGLLVPVPSSPANLKKRGWEPVKLLAQRLSFLAGIPLRTCLRRLKTESQKTLGKRERASNLNGKIRFSGFAGNESPDLVYLVDDVFTTGATVQECSEVLRTAGVKEVRVLCGTVR